MADKKFLDAEGVKHLWEVTRLQNNEDFQTNLEIFEAMAQILEGKEAKKDAEAKLAEAKNYSDEIGAGVLTVATKYTDEKVAPLATIEEVNTKYNGSVVSLSVNGKVVTYVTGDGQTHTFETQDTDTTYTLGTDSTTGLTKLYKVTGDQEDGTMTQKAITEELNKKVSVSVDTTNGILIFSK